MTQGTFELLEAHARDCEFEDRRNYKRQPRPFRRRNSHGKRRRAAKLSMNGRNKTRTTDRAAIVSKLAMKVQAGNV